MTKKVTIEITEDGWQTTLELNGKTYTEKHKRTSYGATSTEGNFENNEEISDDLYDALTSLRQYDVMKALYDN